MLFHAFVSFVADPCCVKDKNNIQNPLPVYRGGLLSNCWDERSGGTNLVTRFRPGDGLVMTDPSVPLGRAMQLCFLFAIAPQTCLLMLLERKTRDGKQRSFQKMTWSKRRRHVRRDVFPRPLLLPIQFLNPLPNIFLPNFEHSPVGM